MARAFQLKRDRFGVGPDHPDGRLCLRRPPAQRGCRVTGRATDRSPPVSIENGLPLPSLSIHLGRTKTSGADHDEVVYLTGRPVEVLNAWLAAAGIQTGSISRKFDRWGNLSQRALEPGAINQIVKQRAALAGLEPGDFQRTGCGRATSPRLPIVAFPCRKQLSSHGTDPCSRLRATITMRPREAGERPV